RLGVVAHEGGEALGDAPGGHDPHRAARVGVDLLGDRDDVPVVGQDDDLLGRHRLDGGQQVGRRRVHRLAAGDDALHAEAVEDALDAVAGGDGDDRGGDRLGDVRRDLDDVLRRGLPHPPLLLDLLHEVGDADLPGAPAVDARLDGRPDVVGVDVAVPDAVAAHDDDRVADAGPHVLEPGDGLVRRLQQVHDLVAQVGDAVVRLVATGLDQV